MDIYKKQFLLAVLTYFILGALFLLGHYIFLDPLSLDNHGLMMILHFIGLVSVLGFGFFRKDILGLIYMVFLVMKMGIFLYLFYQLSIMKTYLKLSIVFYFLYLLVETILIINVIQKTNKTHKN